MVINNDLIDGNSRRRRIKEANELKKAQVLIEIAIRMDKIQIEKRKKYKEGWRDCELIELKAKLVQKVNGLFLIHNSERFLRDLIHIFNYAFFIYNRIKDGEK